MNQFHKRNSPISLLCLLEGKFYAMNLSGNTLLITGGGSGIGRGLAEAFHALGNQVIIAGRRRQPLAETTAANPGMKSLLLGVEDRAALCNFAVQVVGEFPSLNGLNSRFADAVREPSKRRDSRGAAGRIIQANTCCTNSVRQSQISFKHHIPREAQAAK
ncbi:MAG: SDR family NAD(P)-dependent oxidoreductase [Terracidiphilus sp.]